MAKITLADLANLQNEATAVATINNNNALIEAAIELTLSRDGTAPNEMDDDLDMNNNRIYNLPEPLTATEPLRKEDADEILALVDEFEQAVADTAAAVAAYASMQQIYLGRK